MTCFIKIWSDPFFNIHAPSTSRIGQSIDLAKMQGTTEFELPSEVLKIDYEICILYVIHKKILWSLKEIGITQHWETSGVVIAKNWKIG